MIFPMSFVKHSTNLYETLKNFKITLYKTYFLLRFLRPQKEYTPPADVSSKLDTILQKTLGTCDKSTDVSDPNVKFTLLSACHVAFEHGVPNSLLHTIGTLGDVYKFYGTPVCTTTPLDKMRTMELPKNLHVQFEYHRFHPG